MLVILVVGCTGQTTKSVGKTFEIYKPVQLSMLNMNNQRNRQFESLLNGKILQSPNPKVLILIDVIFSLATGSLANDGVTSYAVLEKLANLRQSVRDEALSKGYVVGDSVMIVVDPRTWTVTVVERNSQLHTTLRKYFDTKPDVETIRVEL